jgi:uncharacterized protein
MQCPVCGDRMKEVERQGVSIDLCPGCKGVWLDRGELEKLIVLSQSAPPISPMNPRTTFLSGHSAWQSAARDHHGFGHRDHDRHEGHDHGHDRDHERRDDGHHDHDHADGQGPRRRGSWLSDLFGGDD